MTEPIHILSLGAGVQSSTLALMAAAGEVTPMPVAAVFADTHSEPQSVYRWLDWLEPLLPFPLHRVSRGSLTESITTLRDRKDGKGHWVYSGIPAFTRNADGSDGMIPRQCTYSFKVEVLDKEAKRLGGIKRAQKTVGVIQWIGISLDEVYRMKSHRYKWGTNRWPLVEMRMNRHDCLRWMEAHGYPKPPRSACVYCPYHSDHEWRRLRDEEPADFAEAVRVDKEFRRLKGMAGLKGTPFVHASRVPLDEVDFSTAEDHGQGQIMFNNDCTGMCGV